MLRISQILMTTYLWQGSIISPLFVSETVTQWVWVRLCNVGCLDFSVVLLISKWDGYGQNSLGQSFPGGLCLWRQHPALHSSCFSEYSSYKQASDFLAVINWSHKGCRPYFSGELHNCLLKEGEYKWFTSLVPFSLYFTDLVLFLSVWFR